MRLTNRFLIIAAAGSILAAADSATAGSLTCPGTASTSDREHTLTLPSGTPTGCVTGSGPNDINGSPAQDVFVNAGWTFLDKDQNPDNGTGAIPEDWLVITGIGASAAHFDLAASAWAAYSEISIGFKVGQTSPTWAVFSLPFMTLSGDWSTIPTSGGGGLSHVSLYGKPGDPPAAVPEPASLLLLGSGLAATATKLRKRRKA